MTRRPIITLTEPNNYQIDGLCISADGGRLATINASNASRGGRVIIWDLRLIRAQLKELGLDWSDDPVPGPPRVGPTPVRLEVDYGDVTRLLTIKKHLEEATRLSRNGQPKEAIAEYTKVLELVPDHNGALEGRGYNLSVLGQWEKAIEDYVKRQGSGSEDGGSYWIGYCYAALGRWREAGPWFEKLVKSQIATDWGACALLGGVRLLRGDVSGYEKLCGQFQTLAELEGKLGDPYAACRFCTLGPKSPTDPAKALQWIERETAKGKNAWNVHVLGRAQLRAGQLEAAVRSCKESLEIEPTWPGRMLNWTVLAMAHHRLGQLKEARAWLDKAMQWRDQLPRDKQDRPIAPPGLGLWDWIEFHVLFQEAEALLKAPPEKK
jgi:tetratricopeptide (TPR) repeat protein